MQLCDDLDLAAKAVAAEGSRRVGVEELERDGAVVLHVRREVHRRRAAASDLLHDHIRSDLLTDAVRTRVLEKRRRQAIGRRVEHGARHRVGREHRCNLLAKLVVIAGCRREELLAVFDRALQRALEEIDNLRPPRGHRSPAELRPSRSAAISVKSHARAARQSRSTVPVEMSRSRAVSSVESPAKMRCSTTAARRGSTADSRSSAPSSAISSAGFTGAAWAASSYDTKSGASPPRFAATSRRAASTRICRIARAATAKKWASSFQLTDLADVSLRKAS